MPNYRRPAISGGTYFITQITYRRQKWLCTEIGRHALRTAIKRVQETRPFKIDAFVLLPDHFHCLWTLPRNDPDLSTRIRLVKTYVTRHYADDLGMDEDVSTSRMKRKERNVWQRRFWEHLIRDENDFVAHCDYIHYNPVRHGRCEAPTDWRFSSIHRLIDEGMCAPDWGRGDECLRVEKN
jgi:putative transposase